MVSAKTKGWALIGGLAVPLAIFALMWRAAGHRPRLFIGIGAPATAIVLSRDGSQIVCTSQNGYIQKWMPERGRFNSFALDTPLNASFSSTVPPPVEMRLSGDETSLIAASTGSYESKARSWTMNNRRPAWVLDSQRGPREVYLCALSSDARFMACANTGSVSVVDIAQPLPPFPPSKPTAGTPLMGTSMDTRFLSRFRARATLATPKAAIILALSPDAKRLAFMTYGGTLESWDLAAKTATPLPTSPLQQIATLSFSPDGRFLAATSAGDSSDVAVLDLAAKTWTENRRAATPTPTPVFAGSTMYDTSPLAPAWMPDSKSLWTGGDKVRQWSLSPFAQKRELPVSGPVAVSGDGTVIATRSVPKLGQPDGIWLWPAS